MKTNSEKQGIVREYKKPATKKHDAMNTVQGSALYSTTLYSTTLYSGGLYYVSLYYSY
jgi:hypothetical protein